MGLSFKIKIGFRYRKREKKVSNSHQEYWLETLAVTEGFFYQLLVVRGDENKYKKKVDMSNKYVTIDIWINTHRQRIKDGRL